MKKEPLGIMRGTGNVFRDFGVLDADVRQLKTLLAAHIIKAMDREGLTVRAAQARTGIAAADFSRIRGADLRRFTVDRLIGIINRLGSRVDVRVAIKRGASEVPKIASFPPAEEMRARLRTRPRYTGRISPTEVIRQERDRR